MSWSEGAALFFLSCGWGWAGGGRRRGGCKSKEFLIAPHFYPILFTNVGPRGEELYISQNNILFSGAYIVSNILSDGRIKLAHCKKQNWTWEAPHITYSKGRRGREAFFHPSVPSSIHGWHHTGKKTLAEINTPPPPLRMCRCLGKACPAPVSGLLPWSAVCCYLTGHKQCKHQDFQQPGSWWIHTECGI